MFQETVNQLIATLKKNPTMYDLQIKQAQLRLCKLGPGTVFLIMFLSEIKFLSVALLNQASLVVGRMLTSAYDFYAKFQLPL